MKEDKVVRIAKQIYEQVGGTSNVTHIIHCMTRVRMTIIDPSKVNLVALKAVDGVLGVVDGEILQVVVGPGTANKVAQKMVDMVGVKLNENFPNRTDRISLEERTAQMKAEIKEKYNKPSKIKSILKSIAAIFTPLIPAFVGAGIIGGIASIMGNMITAGQLDADTFQQLVTVLGIIQKGIFAYLVIYVGINTANEFGATPSLGGVIGGITMLTGMNAEAPLINIFTGKLLVAQQGGIISVIFAVWLLSWVEKRLRKVIPDTVDILVTPTLSLLIIGCVTIFLIMPVAGVVANLLYGAVNALLEIGGVAGFVLGASFLPMVMLGLHQILLPIHVGFIEKTGSTHLLPILAMAGAGQVGAALALWVRLRKNKEFTKIVKGALPVGILGIGEPLIYAVTLPMGRPFLTACIGGGIGGAIIAILGHAGAIAVGPSGVALIPLIADGRWFIYVFGLIGAYIGGFIATYFFGIPQEEKDKADAAV